MGVNAINVFLDIDDTLVDYNLVEKEDGYNNVPPLPGAVKFIQRNLQKGNNIYIISWYNKDNPKRLKEKYQWCLRNIPMVSYQNISLIPSPSNKADEAMKLLGANVLSKKDLLIDDNPDNIEQWKKAGGMTFLIDIGIHRWENL